MKLNNKGFAITTVLYGLLIIFVLMTSSYFTVLIAKKNRVEKITDEIEKEYYFNTEKSVNSNINYPYTAPYTGKYIFNNNCYKYFYNGSVISSNSCGNYLVKIYYHGGD